MIEFWKGISKSWGWSWPKGCQARRDVRMGPALVGPDSDSDPVEEPSADHTACLDKVSELTFRAASAEHAFRALRERQRGPGAALLPVVSAASREQSPSEREYWLSVDRGESVLPPIPCRECGAVWVHQAGCITEIPQSPCPKCGLPRTHQPECKIEAFEMKVD